MALQSLYVFTFLILLAMDYPSKSAQSAGPSPSPSSIDPPSPGPNSSAPKQDKWTWCVESADDLALCKEMVRILVSIDPNTDHMHSCVRGLEGDESCMKMINDGDAMFSVFDGGEIWEAYKWYKLVPIRTAYSDVDGSPRYYGVGVVEAGWCPHNSLSDLKGMRSCHTGYGRASGWILPVTYLVNNNIMPVVTTDASRPHDIQSVEAFFQRSCAASDDSDEEICTACKVTAHCNNDDPYYDYAGAFRCLVEGSGDVAFTKGVIPAMYAKGGIYAAADWTNLKDATRYKILCPNASADGHMCADVGDYRSCNFGSAPGHTIMVSNGLDASAVAAFNAVMDAANSNAAYVKLFASRNYSSSEFGSGVSASVAYNGSVQSLLGSLYGSILDLQELNSNTTTSSSSSAPPSPIRIASSILLGLIILPTLPRF